LSGDHLRRLRKACQIEVHTKSPKLTGYPVTGSKDITFGRIRDSYWEGRWGEGEGKGRKVFDVVVKGSKRTIPVLTWLSAVRCRTV
jgi:hypothetical protein